MPQIFGIYPFLHASAPVWVGIVGVGIKKELMREVLCKEISEIFINVVENLKSNKCVLRRKTLAKYRELKKINPKKLLSFNQMS